MSYSAPIQMPPGAAVGRADPFDNLFSPQVSELGVIERVGRNRADQSGRVWHDVGCGPGGNEARVDRHEVGRVDVSGHDVVQGNDDLGGAQHKVDTRVRHRAMGADSLDGKKKPSAEEVALPLAAGMCRSSCESGAAHPSLADALEELHRLQRSPDRRLVGVCQSNPEAYRLLVQCMTRAIQEDTPAAARSWTRSWRSPKRSSVQELQTARCAPISGLLLAHA